MRNCGKAFDWYVGAKEDLYYLPKTADPVPDDVHAFVQVARFPGNPEYKVEEEYYPCYQVTVQLRPDQRPVLQAAFDKAMATGRLTALFETPAQKLLTDESGRVTGVIAKSFDGKVVQVNAKRGVVLATGDYSGNLDMLYYYCPWTRLNTSIYTAQDRNGNVADTGDGHRMGMWIGAQMERGPHAPMAHNMGGPLGVASYLQLDADGNRFMNEDTFGQQIENQLYRLKDNLAWQIFDSAWPEQLKHMSAGHGSVCLTYDQADMDADRINYTLDGSDGYVALDGVEKAVEAGTVVKGDTLEELVEKMGLPKQAALDSIARYNELCHKGHDDDFGKTPKRMFALENGPYYAAKLTSTVLLVCMSGLESDEEARALDSRGHVIPGLYVAGNVQGCRFACEYPTTVPGMSHSMALTYGRHAGENAAKSV
jgi:succinate dehydrogenase/fumarate reductase flavoprotein subunit